MFGLIMANYATKIKALLNVSCDIIRELCYCRIENTQWYIHVWNFLIVGDTQTPLLISVIGSLGIGIVRILYSTVDFICMCACE